MATLLLEVIIDALPFVNIARIDGVDEGAFFHGINDLSGNNDGFLAIMEDMVTTTNTSVSACYNQNHENIGFCCVFFL